MTDQTADIAPSTTGEAPRRLIVFRHSVWVRLTHWIWVISLTILFMSGLQIFNAHPSLNFGNTTTFDTAATGPNRVILDIDNDGSTGVTTVVGHKFDTTGVLGVSQGPDGLAARGFPGWITIPSVQDLATGRRWHFLFAWILVINALVYLAYGLISGHIAHDLVPRLREYRTIPHDIVTHLQLKFSHGPDAPQYNILQKLAYGLILFVVLPVLVLAGLEMSPRIDAALPWLRYLFGGRQSARTIHFLMAWTLVGFVIIHVVMVVLSGPFNNMRSMITGRVRRQRGIRPHEHDRSSEPPPLSSPAPPVSRLPDATASPEPSKAWRDRAVKAAERCDLCESPARPASGQKMAPEYAPSRDQRLFQAERLHRPQGSWPTRNIARREIRELFKLAVGGLVAKPRSVHARGPSGAEPARTQITRHDCVEGWSCIGQWTGVPLHEVLQILSSVQPEARYVVFHCFDNYNTDYTTETVSQDDGSLDSGGGSKFYGSIGMAGCRACADAARLRR